MAEQLYLDRSSFIAWTRGILLDLKKGCGVVGDHRDHDRAEQVLKQGGRVFLTVRGRPVSEMVEKPDGYHELPLKEEDPRCIGVTKKRTRSSRTSG